MLTEVGISSCLLLIPSHGRSQFHTRHSSMGGNRSVQSLCILLLVVLCFFCNSKDVIAALNIDACSCGTTKDLALPLPKRLRTVSIIDFGGVGDGATLNTDAFRKAIAYAASFADQGGTQLNIPTGTWLTGSFNLCGHLTLYLQNGAVILGSPNSDSWPVIDPLPSYGRGRELPGKRHISLIHGESLTDVIITGENGTVDGQGAVWWQWSRKGLLNFTRPHLVEFMHSSDIIIYNVTFKNSPFWTVHPVYSRNMLIQFVTILAPQGSPDTDGIDPDSSSDLCIQDCYISNGDDMIAIKSGWDEYGIAYGVPSSNIYIHRVTGQTKLASGFAIGSETSGGVSNIQVRDLKVVNSKTGISIRTNVGRGAYIHNISIENVELVNVGTAISLLGSSGEHPDANYNAEAAPDVGSISIQNVYGNTLDRPGRIEGIPENPFKHICFSDINLQTGSGLLSTWKCSFVEGFSAQVSPQACPQMLNDNQVEASKCFPALIGGSCQTSFS
ncbi:hypothetical protein O6H91_01G111400 [Diphasiastrum complanatum]|uniref:Uncharacterized protein n=1 Tax=Diphasiastrum complanatum TaxID=34168 RepID=A0ACC2EUX7_DIPCM|nr:hypothetical protein O6H91_01G111400 [Diphasiastrum complanatum]